MISADGGGRVRGPRVGLLLILFLGTGAGAAGCEHSSGSSPIVSVAAPKRPPLPDSLGEWIDAYASGLGRAWGSGDPFSGYLLVARDGVPVYARAYGKSNRRTGAVADGDTRFCIASLTKSFTAVAMMQLVERGRVRLDDPVSKYVPGLPFGDRVTLHNCLSHTSGIADWNADPQLLEVAHRPQTHARVLASFSDKPLAFEPGSAFQYSNSNYFLLSLVIEQVTGQTYASYLEEHVLRPAGLSHTSTRNAPDEPDTAAGYVMEDDDRVERAQQVDESVLLGGGALRSTANDLVRWDRALEGATLLSPASKARLFLPTKNDYGYGFRRLLVQGHVVEGHTGLVRGFYTDFERAPEDGLVVIALSNVIRVAHPDGFYPDAIAPAILSMAITGTRIEPPRRTFDEATLTRFPGEYDLDDESSRRLQTVIANEVWASVQSIMIARDGAQLRIKPNGQPYAEVFPDPRGNLRSRSGVEITASPAAGPVASFVLKQGNLEARYVRRAGR